MVKTYIIIFSLFWVFSFKAQISRTAAELEAQPVGGKQQVEQVLQTQLTLPKVLLSSAFEKEVTAFFDLDSAGNAINLKFEGGLNNVLRNEMKRIFRFLKFSKTQSSIYEAEPYFYVFKISTEKYNKYFKQKSKINLKKNLSADSSYAVYSRAEISPEYFKNGDEGLKEFILSEIEYPKLALEKSIEGSVVLEFIIETNGYVTEINPKQSIFGGCLEEAIRIIKQTKWQPAELNKKFVRYKTTYPITFSLRNVSKDNGTSTQPIGQ
jgi:TonB family protein